MKGVNDAITRRQMLGSMGGAVLGSALVSQLLAADHPALKLPGFPLMVAAFLKVDPKFTVDYDEGLKASYKWYDAETKPV